MLPELINALQAPPFSHVAAFGALILTSIVFISYELVRWLGRIRGFGGPAGMPIVGNLWQIRGKDAPEQYRIWSRKHGAVYQIQLGNIPVLVINSSGAAKEMLVHNSQATKSRPEFYTFHKVRSPTLYSISS
jgi:3-hydroxyphenylacetate 6-hydroxylase